MYTCVLRPITLVDHDKLNSFCHRAVEINIGIIVACASCFPVFYNTSKEYLSSATTTIRQLLLTSKEAPRHTEKNTSSIALAKANTPSTAGEYRFMRTQHTSLKIIFSHLFALVPRIKFGR
jgi:hypothetical protein